MEEPDEPPDRYGPISIGLFSRGLGMPGKFFIMGEDKPRGLFTSGDGIFDLRSG